MIRGSKFWKIQRDFLIIFFIIYIIYNYSTNTLYVRLQFSSSFYLSFDSFDVDKIPVLFLQVNIHQHGRTVLGETKLQQVNDHCSIDQRLIFEHQPTFVSFSNCVVHAYFFSLLVLQQKLYQFRNFTAIV